MSEVLLSALTLALAGCAFRALIPHVIPRTAEKES